MLVEALFPRLAPGSLSGDGQDKQARREDAKELAAAMSDVDRVMLDFKKTPAEAAEYVLRRVNIMRGLMGKPPFTLEQLGAAEPLKAPADTSLGALDKRARELGYPSASAAYDAANAGRKARKRVESDVPFFGSIPGGTSWLARQFIPKPYLDMGGALLRASEDPVAGLVDRSFTEEESRAISRRNVLR
jgi:hypothetical protein